VSTFSRDPELKHMVESLISNAGGSGDGFQQKVLSALDSFLEPGEMLLAYAYCPPLESNQTDVFAYVPGGPRNQTDAFDYPRAANLAQTDVFAYDTERGRQQPDVMGYPARGRSEDNDAFAYPRPRPSPDNDAFMAPARFNPTLHFLLLTDRRLVDGLMDQGVLALSQALTPVRTNAWVQTSWAPAD
jgi:hypothetical protein